MYISKSEVLAGRAAGVRNPGHALMKGAIMHFSLVTSVRRRLKGPLTSRDGVMIACWSTDIGPVITELISQFTDTRRDAVRCACGRHSRLTAFYGRVIRSVTADRVIDVQPPVSLQAVVLISPGRRYMIIVERMRRQQSLL